jgi:AcrR family transcriptional regulator
MDAARLAKDTPKSQKTRARILDCAMRLIAEIGYHAATNPVIADAAGLTRGAMLYHFPTREALVEAAVAHIQAERSTLFRAAAENLPAGADVTEHAIDSYWDLLHSDAVPGLRRAGGAGRTDPAIHALLAPAQAEFDRAQAGDHFLKILHAGAGPRFQASRDLARFMLEGLARTTLTYDKDGRKERLLMLIKRATHMLNRKGDVQDLWPE